jgi:hypothetical protein
MSDTTIPPTGNYAYAYRVFAINAVGSTFPGSAQATVWSTTPTNTVKVSPPTGTVTVVSLTQAVGAGKPVVVTWTYAPAGDQTGFEILRATNSAFTSGLTYFTANAGATTYRDTSVVAGRTYFYKVRATNFLGKTAWSNFMSIRAH